MDNKESHSEYFEELCSGYALNALDDGERAEFEELLSDATDEQLRLYQALSSTANQLAFTIERKEPSEALKGQIFAQIQTDSESLADASPLPTMDSPGTDAEEEGAFDWPAFTAAASFALLIVSLSLLFYSFNLSSKIDQQETAFANQETEITELVNEIEQKEEMLAILASRQVNMVLMSGLEINPDGYGKVIWDSEKQQALLQVANLPPVPPEKDYQLWLIRDNEPVNAGVFAVHDSSDTFFRIEEVPKAIGESSNAFAITLEPKGGAPQPTGEMYLLGNMEE